MSETEPWYVKHSREPEGKFGEGAMDNPENRRGVPLYHHNEYDTKDIKESINKGLEILKEDKTRVVMVGGDLNSCHGMQKYYHIRWDSENGVYIISDEENTEREKCNNTMMVFKKLNRRFKDNSLVCVLLIYIDNSPFITSGPSGSATDYMDIKKSKIINDIQHKKGTCWIGA